MYIKERIGDIGKLSIKISENWLVTYDIIDSVIINVVSIGSIYEKRATYISKYMEYANNEEIISKE